MTTPQIVTQEQVREFVGSAHGDLETVRRLYEETPTLLNARYDEWNETALEAASHMGARDIASYLLDQGAKPMIFSAAMLGMAKAVRVFLDNDPGLVSARGVHGISLMYHAAMSGETAIAELLAARGGGDGMDEALHGAVAFGRNEMVRWLLEHGVQDVNLTNWQGKTPLQVAIEKGHDEIAELLRARGGIAQS